MELALRLLADARYDALLGEPIAFNDVPAALPRLLGGSHAAVTSLIAYE